ncbi:TVP38/TMEM64 family protein [Azospirillum sp. sgz302134]
MKPAPAPIAFPAWGRWTMLIAALVAAVVVPFLLFADQMDALAASVAEGAFGWGGAAVLGGLLAGDILLPVPSSMVSTACGVLFGFPVGMAVSTAGLTGGCLIGYGMGRFLSGERLARLVSPAGAARVSAVMDRHGVWALVMLRGVPVLAEISVVMAGMLRLPLNRFVVATLLSNLGLSAAYAAAGAWAWDGGMTALAPFIAAIGLPAAARFVTAGVAAR